MTHDKKREILADLNPSCLLLDGYEDALVGFTCPEISDPVAVYDKFKIFEILKNEMGCNAEEAEEFYSFNIAGSINRQGQYPIIIERFE